MFCLLSFYYISVELTLVLQEFSTVLSLIVLICVFIIVIIIYLCVVSVVANVMDAGAANSSYNKATNYRSPLQRKNSRDDVCVISLSV